MAEVAREGLEAYIGELRGLKEGEAREYGHSVMSDVYGNATLFGENKRRFTTLNARHAEEYVRSNLDNLLHEAGEGLAGFLYAVNPQKDAANTEQHKNSVDAHEKYRKAADDFEKIRKDPSEAHKKEISNMELSVKKSLSGYNEKDVIAVIDIIKPSIRPEIAIRQAQRKVKHAENAFQSLFNDVIEVSDYVRANVKYGVEHSDPEKVGEAYQYVPFLIEQKKKDEDE